MDSLKLRKAAQKYLEARKEFLTIADKTIELSGNDNIIGRIGEFIAYQILADQNRNPRKNDNPTQKGYDLVCENNIFISVKTITSENKTKRTTRITEPWHELVLIYLNENNKIEKIGHLKKSEFAIALEENKNWGSEPYCKLSMLNPDGLIGKYGKVLIGNEIKNWL